MPNRRAMASMLAALSMVIGSGSIANAVTVQDLPTSASASSHYYATVVHQEQPIAETATIDLQSIEDLFTKYINLDARNFMYLNEEVILESPYRDDLEELMHFTKFMNEINARNLGIQSRDAWSFAKCVVADAVGVNMVSRLTKGLYTAIRAAQWPLAAKTILQIGASAGLNLGWKANAVGLAIALGKSAIYCSNKW